MEIDLSIIGAKSERQKLKDLHVLLNKEDVVPEQAYRMSRANYSLVCFVNNIICLYLSKNYEVIPIFISRAHRHMVDFPANPAAKAYYEHVYRYLCQMAYVLKTYTSVSSESIALIPNDVLNAIEVQSRGESA
jgi:hypothetical protein